MAITAILRGELQDESLTLTSSSRPRRDIPSSSSSIPSPNPRESQSRRRKRRSKNLVAKTLHESLNRPRQNLSSSSSSSTISSPNTSKSQLSCRKRISEKLVSENPAKNLVLGQVKIVMHGQTLNREIFFGNMIRSETYAGMAAFYGSPLPSSVPRPAFIGKNGRLI